MLFYITIAPFASTVNWWVLFFENLKNLKRHPFFQGCLMLPGMSGWRSLNQANRNGRIRTSIAPQRVINCAALPIKLHSDNWRPAGGYQTSHAFWEGVGSRRLYALGFRLHYNILSRDIWDIRDKLLFFIHKSLIFFLYTVRCCSSPHLNRHFSPLIRKDKLIPEIPQNRIK